MVVFVVVMVVFFVVKDYVEVGVLVIVIVFNIIVGFV